MPELLIGCGSSRKKKLTLTGGNKEWSELVTLDVEPRHNPTVLHDLEVFPYPFEDSTFDEIHAYEVLEHTGTQGDYRFFFRQFEELWRILKPGGLLLGSTPWFSGEWAWGDPGHKRVFTPGVFTFLSQAEYVNQVGRTALSDYRSVYSADFEVLFVRQLDETKMVFGLKAIKEQR